MPRGMGFWIWFRARNFRRGGARRSMREAQGERHGRGQRWFLRQQTVARPHALSWITTNRDSSSFPTLPPSLHTPGFCARSHNSQTGCTLCSSWCIQVGRSLTHRKSHCGRWSGPTYLGRARESKRWRPSGTYKKASNDQNPPPLQNLSMCAKVPASDLSRSSAATAKYEHADHRPTHTSYVPLRPLSPPPAHKKGWQQSEKTNA